MKKKITCFTCSGDGQIYVGGCGDETCCGPSYARCPDCEGEGIVEVEETYND